MSENSSPGLDPFGVHPPADHLGAGLVNVAEIQEYDARRQAAAINIAATLVAKDAEANRQQVEANTAFINGLSHVLPSPSLEFENSSQTGIPMYFRHATVSTFHYRPRHEGVSGLTGDLLADISTMRASSIWLRRPAKELIKDAEVVSDFDVRGKIVHPYLLLGRKTGKPSDANIEILLMPYGNEDAFSGGFRCHYGAPVAAWVGDMIKARIPSVQFERLLDTQETLFDTSFDDHEVNILQNDDSSFTLSPERALRLIKADETSKLGAKLKGFPSSHDELSTRSFSLVDVEVVKTLSPVEFAEFEVLKFAHRAAAMTGRSKGFENIQAKLVADSPTITVDALLAEETANESD